jgi:hypothetical protein
MEKDNFKVRIKEEHRGALEAFWLDVTHNGYQYSGISVYNDEETKKIIAALEKTLGKFPKESI